MTMIKRISVDPRSLVGDAWMYDSVARLEFDEGLKRMDIALEPWSRVIENSARLTEKDYDLVINV